LTTLTIEAVQQRAAKPEPTQRVIFRVEELYGISEGTRFPLNETDSIDTGQICLTMDPKADLSANIGSVDFDNCTMRVRYGVQGEHDLSLLGPIRAVATDECTLTPQLTGWRALGCLEMLPGSLWSGAKGG
jgi:hypothetical protein